MWFTLLVDLKAAYAAIPPETSLIDRVWNFADWCFDRARHATVRAAVAVSFYEQVPHFGPARREMAERLSLTQFDNLMPYWRVCLTERELEEFVREFLQAKGLSRNDVRKRIAELR